MDRPPRFIGIVKESIEYYNKYRAPEATARLIANRRDMVEVEFEGSFCESCGIIDWIEDLAYIMVEKGLEVELIAVKDTDNDYIKIGVFKVKKPG